MLMYTKSLYFMPIPAYPPERPANINIVHGERAEGKSKIDSLATKVLELDTENVSIPCSGLHLCSCQVHVPTYYMRYFLPFAFAAHHMPVLRSVVSFCEGKCSRVALNKYTLFFIRNRFIRNLHVEGRNI